MGQTSPSAWGVPVCDQVSLPAVVFVTVAAVACLGPLWIARLGATAGRFIASAVVISVFGLALAWPLLGPCLAGPYGALPEDLQIFIATRITETKPIHLWAIGRYDDAAALLLPVVAATMLGAWCLWRQGEAPESLPERHRALLLVMFLLLLGVVVLFYQMRTIIIISSIVPIVTGVVLARLLVAYFQARDGIRAAIFIGSLVVFLSPASLVLPVAAVLPATEETQSNFGNPCRSHASLSALNAVPPARILVHGSFGPSLLWATHHSSLSSAFHRSAEALRNSYMPFETDEAEMRDYVLATNATHLLLCKGFPYAGSYASALSTGEGPVSADWLVPVAVDDEYQLLFEIVR